MRNSPTMMLAQAHIEDLHRQARERALVAQALRARAEERNVGVELRTTSQRSWLRRLVARGAI